MKDSEIIDLFWSRSEIAIEETSNKYGSMCLQIAQNIVLNYHDAEECVNDTYWGLWNTIPPARPNVLGSFIAKLTRNIAMKKITYANAKKRSVHLTVSLNELDDCIQNPIEMETDIEAQDLAESLERFLKNTDCESRNMFLRRYWFFDSIEDIAKRFDVSQSKVKSQLYRTRNKLTKHLIKEGYING